MTFLNPLILFALPAVALPVIIHLFTRAKVRKVRFSTLTFLKELQQQKIRSVKIRQILLLIIRTLIILMLVLTFARPTLRGNFSAGIGTRVKTSAAIILDNSVSMAGQVKGKSLFDRARERASAVLDIFKPGDQVFLIFPETQQPLDIRGYHDLKLVRRLIENASISYKMTDLSSALKQAYTALSQSRNFNREIYLISDLQATGFDRSNDSSLAQSAKEFQLFILDLGKDRYRNLALKDVVMKSQIIERSKVIELAVTVENEGVEPETNKLIQLFINGKRTAQAAISLQPDQSTTTDLRFTLDESGLHTGYVQLEEDDLPHDDRRDFCFFMPGEIKILLIGNNLYDTANLELALKPGASKISNFRIERLKMPELSSEKIANANVIFLVNVPEIDASVAILLEEFVNAGGGLVLILGDNVNLRHYNEGLNAKLALPRFGETIGQRDDPTSAFGIDKVDFSHPIFSGMFQKKEQRFESPQVLFAVRVKPGLGSQSIIQYSDGHPFLIETRYGKGSVLMFTTGIQQEWCNLSQKTIFAPLIHRSVSYLASLYSEKPISLLIGEAIKYELPEVLLKELEVIRPNQARVKINPRTIGAQYRVEFTETDVPGIYTIQNNSQTLAQWAVSLDPEESEVKPVEFDVLKRRYHAEKIAKSVNIADFVEKQRYGRELWKYLAFLVLGLLIIEMMIYREQGEVTDASKEHSLAN